MFALQCFFWDWRFIKIILDNYYIQCYIDYKEEWIITETNLYRLYYNQRTTEVVASSFEMAFASEKSWYSKETILFVENVITSEIRKFIV